MNLRLLAEATVAALFQPTESSRWAYRMSRPISDSNNNSADVPDLLREQLAVVLSLHGYVIDETLQVNVDARRIVAACRSPNGAPAVAKWHDDSMVGTFAFAKSHSASEFAHFQLASELPDVIPRGILLHENLLLLERAGGNRIIDEWRLTPDRRGELVERIAKKVSGTVPALQEVAVTHKREYATILSERLAWLTSYGVHLKSSPGALGVAHGLLMASDAQAKHAALVRAFIAEGNRIAAEIEPIWSSRDLDELNIHVGERHIHIVDWDSAGLTFISLEFAMLASRLIALAIIDRDTKQASHVVACFHRQLQAIAPLEGALFLTGLQLHLLYLQINPWMWPNHSSFEMRRDSLAQRALQLRYMKQWFETELFPAGMASGT